MINARLTLLPGKASHRKGEGLRGIRFLVAGLALIATWVFVLKSYDLLFIMGDWFLHASIVVAVPLLISSMMKARWDGATRSAFAVGALSGVAVLLAWLVVDGQLLQWMDAPGDTASRVGMEVFQSFPPMSVAPPFEDVVLTAMYAGSTLSSYILLRFRAPLVAGIGVLLLLLVPAIVSGYPLSDSTLIGAGLLLVLLAWIGSPRLTWSGMAAAGTALALAITAVAILPQTRDRVWNQAMIAPPIGITVPDVTVALARDVQQQSDVTAFTFSANAAGPYRFVLATLADFSGGRWYPEEEPASSDLTLLSTRDETSLIPALFQGDEPQSYSVNGETGEITPIEGGIDQGIPVASARSVTVTIEGLVSSWLPIPQAATSVTTTNESGKLNLADWQWTATANTAHANRALTHRGDTYTADSKDLNSSSSASFASWASWAGLFDPSVNLINPQKELVPYLELPEGLPASMSSKAQEVTAGVSGSLAMGLALEDFFRSGEFVYDESAPYVPGEDSSDPYDIMEALLRDKRGFCVHYASTFAVMARSLGIPTRIAVGYSTTAIDSGLIKVKGRQLHAWPEIYAEGLGWVSFEPTPGGAGGDQLVLPNTSATSSASPSASSAPTATAAPQQEPTDTDPGGGVAVPQEQSEGTSSLRGTIARVVLVLVLLLALLALPAVIRIARRRGRHRAIARGRNPATAAWEEFVDTSVDLGWGAPGPRESDVKRDAAHQRAATPEAFLESLGERQILSGEALAAARQLAARMAAERYGNKTMGHDIRPLLSSAEEGLRGAASQKARTAAFLRPRSLAYAVRTRRRRRSFRSAE